MAYDGLEGLITTRNVDVEVDNVKQRCKMALFSHLSKRSVVLHTRICGYRTDSNIKWDCFVVLCMFLLTYTRKLVKYVPKLLKNLSVSMTS